MANKHLIGKQVMQVEVHAWENSYALQQQLSEMVWKELAPKLSGIFDRYAGEDEVLRLDRIELDLGEIDLKASNYNKITTRILQLLEAELQHYKSRDISKTGSHFSRDLSHTEGQSVRDYMFRLWMYWLEKGILPPYVLKPEGNWIPQVLETLGMEYRAVSALAKTLRNNPNSLKRLILQHRQNDLKSITELYTGHSQKDLALFFDEFRQFIKQNPQSARLLKMNFREWEIQSWELIFREVILKSKKLDSQTLIAKILLSLPKNILQKMQEIAEKRPKTYPQFTQALKLINSERKNVDKTPRLESEENTPDKEIAEKREIQELLEEMESPQFFKNAGLVLLNPFFLRFFEKLGLVEDKKFKDFYSQSKAVFLMHFLATGEEHIPEYEMLLPKFLCAIPANLPIDHTLFPTKEEKEEANGLLEAVIQNWGALGSTSPDGLREGFLIRDGKLQKTGSGWKLIVEPKTIDVLLDRLPWGIGMVKLPWMDELLKVDWR